MSTQMGQEDYAAALLLLSWKKHLDIDPQTARELEEKKRRPKLKLKCVSPPPTPTHHRRYCPPVATLRGLVGEYCSQPWEKQLKDSDIEGHQRRLLLKQSYVTEQLYPLLTRRELEGVKKGGIVVNVYDSQGNMYEMVFKLWGKKAHVLTTWDWLRFCSDHNFVSEVDWITIWMFKHVHTHKVCFAIVSVRRPLPTLTGSPEKLSSLNGRKRSRKNIQ